MLSSMFGEVSKDLTTSYLEQDEFNINFFASPLLQLSINNSFNIIHIMFILIVSLFPSKTVVLNMMDLLLKSLIFKNSIKLII